MPLPRESDWWRNPSRTPRCRCARRVPLEALVLGSLRYARARQFEEFLANPDPEGPSTTSYVYETSAPERGAAPEPRLSDGSTLPAALLVGGLALLGVGLVVAWSRL